MARRNTVEVVIKATDKASGPIKGVSGTLKNLGMAAILGAAAGAAASAVKAIGSFAQSLAQVAREGVAMASQMEGVKAAFEGITAASGESSSAMLEALQKGSAGMVNQMDLMKSYNMAAQLVSATFANQLPAAMEMLTKVSAATGESMDYMMTSLVRGVGRLSPMILDNLGVQVDLTRAYQQFADELGVTVEQMSKADQQTALFNETLRQLEITTAAMPEVALTAAQGMAAFRANVENLQMSIGTALLPAVKSITESMNNAIGTFQGAIEEGGALHPVMMRLSAGAAVVADGLGNLAERAVDAGIALVADLSASLSGAAESALRWGINISVSLAEGLIQGAVAAITAAMDFIGGLLSFWLGPGSPPRVAPDIDKWGTAAATEWLQGFTEVEFDILTGIQRPLKSALDALVRVGEISAEDMAQVYGDLTGEIIVALDEFSNLGEVNDEIFTSLSDNAGVFGEQLAELARRQFALASATKAVQDAEDKLKKSREELTERERVLGIMREDLEKARGKVSPKRLAVLKRTLRMEEQALMKAQTRAEVDAKALEDAREKEKAQRGGIGLQKQLLAQLTEMVRLQTQAAEEATRAGGGGGGAGGAAGVRKAGGGAGGALTLPIPEIPAFGAGGLPGMENITSAFDDMKENIREKLTGLLQPVRDAWERTFLPSIERLASKWEWFTGIVGQFWDENVQPVIDELKKLVPPDVLTDIGRLGGVILVATAAFVAFNIVVGIASAIIGALTSPLGLVIAALTVLYLAWKNNWGGIRDTLTAIWEGTIRPALETLWAWLQTKVPAAIETLKEFWETTLLPALEKVWAFIQDNIIPILEDVAEVAETVVGMALSVLTTIWETILLPALETVWGFIEENLLPLFEALADFYDTVMTKALEALAGIWQNVLQPSLENVWEQISTKLLPIFEDIKKFIDGPFKKVIENAANIILPKIERAFGGIGKAIQDIIGWIRDLTDKFAIIKLPAWMQPGSPTPLELGLRGIANELREISRFGIPDFRASLGGNGITGASQNSYNLTIHTNAPVEPIVDDFAMMQVLAGA